MIVFFTKATQHLAPALPFAAASYIAKQFSDGQWYIKVKSDVAHNDVWVIAATPAPADNLVELFLLLNALQRAQARIHLLFTYFGYARQDRPEKGEAAAAQMLCTFFKTFDLKKVVILHPHSPHLHDFLSFQALYTYDLICSIARRYDGIVAPDQGAHDLIKNVASHCDLKALYLSKMRPEQERVEILEYDGIVPPERVLIIDDIIATGNTIIEAAKKIKELGAQHVSVWATHGIFSGNAVQALESSAIDRVYVTNSLEQNNLSAKIEVVSIAPLIELIIKQD